MPLWLWLVDSLALIVGLAIVGLLVLVLRRRALERSGVAFEMSVNRRAEPSPKGWTLGVAVYRDQELHWYRTFSYAWRPRHRFRRGEVLIEGRRSPDGQESFVLHQGHVVVSCESAAGIHQLAMTPQSLTGLLAWLESSPPGHGVNRVV